MRSLLPILLLIVLAAGSTGRMVPLWPYEDLVAAADVVAIVELDSFRPSSEQLLEHGDPSRFIARIAALDVAWLIKGDRQLKRLDLLFFGYVSRERADNGAMFISFPDPERKQYLVFLKEHSSGGLYVPVSGHYDAAISVKVLQDDFFSRRKPNKS